MQIIIDIPEEVYNNIRNGNDRNYAIKNIAMCAIENGTPLPTIIDSLKELSKDHRHNFVGNSHEERAWRLGIEDSIDLILAESEEDK